jgi:hypothetical protein
MTGISQYPTFSIAYKNTRQVSSEVFLREDISDQGSKPKVCLNFIFHQWVVT